MVWSSYSYSRRKEEIIVLRRGTENGLKGWIPAGGHWDPISTLGDKLLWKKAQKNEEKEYDK